MNSRRFSSSKIAEIDGVQCFQPRLIGGVKFLAAPVGEHRAVARRNLVRRKPAIFPAVDDPGEEPRRPALVVDVGGAKDLLHQPDLIVGIQNREIGFEAHQLRMPPQDFRADRMERAEPRHPLHRLADHRADALLHFARRAIGEGDGQNLRGPRAPGREHMRDPRRQHARLAGARAREHQHRPVERFHGLQLLGVEPFEIGRVAVRRLPRARGDAARLWRRRLERVDIFQRIGQNESFREQNGTAHPRLARAEPHLPRYASDMDGSAARP